MKIRTLKFLLYGIAVPATVGIAIGYGTATGPEENTRGFIYLAMIIYGTLLLKKTGTQVWYALGMVVPILNAYLLYRAAWRMANLPTNPYWTKPTNPSGENEIQEAAASGKSFSRRGLLTIVAWIAGGLTLVVLSSYATSSNWLAAATGNVYSEEDMKEAKADSYEEGLEEGLRQGRLIAASVQTEAVDDLEEAKDEAREEGLLKGAQGGCEFIFNMLGTDRVMDFWIYHRGGSWADYYSVDICDGLDQFDL